MRGLSRTVFASLLLLSLSACGSDDPAQSSGDAGRGGTPGGKAGSGGGGAGGSAGSKAGSAGTGGHGGAAAGGASGHAGQGGAGAQSGGKAGGSAGLSGSSGQSGTGQGGAGAPGAGSGGSAQGEAGEGGAGGEGEGGVGGAGEGGTGEAGANSGGSGSAGASSGQGGAGSGGKAGTGGASGQGGKAGAGAGGAGGAGSGGAGSGGASSGGASSGGASSGGAGSGGAGCDAPETPEDVLTAHPKGTTCAKLGYYDYLPVGYEDKGNWPVLLAFHGDGQRGDGSATELALLLKDGLTKAIAAGKWDPKKRFVVLAPQMDDRNGKTERKASSVAAFVEFAKATYKVDPKRIYLTGLSGGGAPVYNYLGAYGGGDAAAANINAGWYTSKGKECSWESVPMWYFHSDKDSVVVPANHTDVSYANLVGCNPPIAPRYTMYANMGHTSWRPTYDLTGMDAVKFPLVTSPPGTTPYDISLYDWLLTHTK